MVSSKSRVTVAKKAWGQHLRPRDAPSLRSGRLFAVSLQWGAGWQCQEIASSSNCSSCGQEEKEERRGEGKRREEDEMEGGREDSGQEQA